MRYFILFCFSLLLAAMPTHAATKAEKIAFKKAYKHYTQIIETDATKEDILDAAQQAFKAGKKVYDTSHLNYTMLANNVGEAAFILNDHKLAAQHFKISVEGLAAHYGADDDQHLQSLMLYAYASIDFNSSAKAEKIYKQVIKIINRTRGENSIVAVNFAQQFGAVLYQYNMPNKAIKYYEKAKDIVPTNHESHEQMVAYSDFLLGKAYLTKRRHKKAEKYLKSSVDFYDRTDPSGRQTLSGHAFLVRTYEKLGMSDKATEHCRAIGKNSPIENNADYQPVYILQPTYPRSAQVAGKEGHVIVSLTVDDAGFVKNPKVLETKGSREFKRAALEVAKQFRYAPRYENGQPVATHDVKYKFSFTLN